MAGLSGKRLYTPKGSNMRVGSNANAWENSTGYTPEQTAAGFGAVPPMTMVQPNVAPRIDVGNTVNPSGDTASWWNQNKDTIGGVAQGVQALAGLANAYMGYKNYGLAKDQFNFAKAAANRDVANQARLINNEIQNAGEVGMGLAGNTMDPNARAQRQAQLDAMKVSGAPIG